jgi:hypothetical protein
MDLLAAAAAASHGARLYRRNAGVSPASTSFSVVAI